MKTVETYLTQIKRIDKAIYWVNGHNILDFFLTNNKKNYIDWFHSSDTE